MIVACHLEFAFQIIVLNERLILSYLIQDIDSTP